MRLLIILLAALIALAAVAPSTAQAHDPNEPWVDPLDTPDWKPRFERDMQHHLGMWGTTTLVFLGLETGYFLAGINHEPGWFQGATVNLLFIGIGVSGLVTNALVLEAIRTSTDRRRMAHYLRRAGIAAMAIGTGMVNLMMVLVQPLDWAGWDPEFVGLFALPAGAFVAMGVLAHWATLAEPPRSPWSAERYDPRRFRPQVVAASPAGFVVHF